MSTSLRSRTVWQWRLAFLNILLEVAGSRSVDNVTRNEGETFCN